MSTEDQKAALLACLEETLTPQRFEAYLASLDPEAIVGIAQEGEACPITNYVKATCPLAKSVRTDGDGEVIVWLEADVDLNLRHTADIRLLQKNWTRAFVAQVDRAGDKGITAQQALDCLHNKDPFGVRYDEVEHDCEWAGCLDYEED